MSDKVPVHEMKLRLRWVMIIGLGFFLLSGACIGLMFAGFGMFKWGAAIFIPAGAIFIMSCAVLAMLGKIEKE